MEYRHEWKHEINASDLFAIRQRLRTVAQLDPHATDGCYKIRSLYFDTPEDRALWEKINGVGRREKFRIRCYDDDFTHIHLEKKSKQSGLCKKESAPLTIQEMQALLDGRHLWMQDSPYALIREFSYKMKTQKLLPKTIVDYVREPFVFAPGNVRVTLDHHIRTGLGGTDFLNLDCITIPVEGDPIILEVKWDSFLPSVILDAVQLDGRHTCAFSKYAACRIYG